MVSIWLRSSPTPRPLVSMDITVTNSLLLFNKLTSMRLLDLRVSIAPGIRLTLGSHRPGPLEHPLLNLEISVKDTSEEVVLL